MTTLINKESTQHYANKMVLAENRKVGSKSLPTALNEIDALIDEMKTYFDAEYGSALDMKLENNENVFSIGTGTNVDKRSEVENSFTDVELSGNSLVNCVLIDKLYEDSNYLEFENSPVITEGNITLKSRQHNHVRFCPKIECGVIKPNTKYTLIFNVTSNNLTGRTNLTHTNTDTLISAFPFTNTIQPKQTGIFKYVLTSKADIGSCNTLLRTIIWNDCSTRDETITFSLMILEGDWTNKPIPQYFEGLKSVGEKEDGNHKISISSVGKNLVNNIVNEWEVGSIDGVNGTDVTTTTRIRMKNFATLPKKEGYLSCKYFGDYKLAIRFYNKKFECISGKDKPYQGFIEVPKIEIPNSAFYYKLVCASKSESEIVPSEISNCMCQLELGETTPVSYTNFRLNKKEISLNEPLRGLPNGIKDTIEKINGEWKIVRRCVQIDLNGTEYWHHENPSQEDGVNTALFATNEILNAKDFPKICDRFIAKNSNLMLNSHPDSEGVGCWSAKKNVNIRINKNRLSTVDSTGLKAWLSQNPTKVLFELKTPIIEDISPATLQCWKNGTISIDEILPVETTHTVALNKPAQIKKNIEELTALRKKVQALEEQYDQIALEQAHQLSLINHSYELDYNR